MKKSLGVLITELRKEKGMTQAQLAEQMGVTDKAVSKWERDLSCPDISSVPKLAEILGVTVDQLMQGEKSSSPINKKVQEITALILRAVPLAMGIAVTVLMILKQLDARSGMIMLGIGLASISVYLLQDQK